MLLTAGNIEDMPATKDMLVELSSHPCSVIIIGIGDKFRSSSMNELDGDDGVLFDSKGKAIERDIVQFVGFNEALKMGNLAELVLKEIPD